MHAVNSEYRPGKKESYDNDNDNNEIIFIAKWHTDHVQRTGVAEIIYMKYIKPGKGGLKP